VKAIAPAIVAAPQPAPLPAPVAQAPCDFAATFAAEQNFEFDRAELTEVAKRRIDEEIINKLVSCNKVDIIIVTGHTDRLGSQQYNQKLSYRRAEAVAAYIKSKNVTAPIDTVGAGETQPAKTCSGKMQRDKLIACLAPNRRVVIEVRGHAN
jgi:OOP family OmpA-OmpF porin